MSAVEFSRWITGRARIVACGLLTATLGTAALLAFAAPAIASSAAEEFGISSFTTAVTGESGATYTQAGGHPYAASTTITLDNGGLDKQYEGGVKNLLVDLPPGFVGDPQAVPQCPEYLLTNCPVDTQIGTATVYGSGSYFTDPVYNMVPDGSHPAVFGFSLVFPDGPATFLYPSVRTGSDYGLRISTLTIPEFNIFAVTLTLWGVPADPSHDGQRGLRCNSPSPIPPTSPADCEGAGSEGGDEPSEAPQAPFLTNPTDCAAGPLDTVLSADSWLTPDLYHEATAVSPAVTGCEALSFDPSIGVAPSSAAEGGTTEADEPSGYTVKLGVPQNEDRNELATPELKDAVVTLPEGVSISPPAAEGLQGCSEAQFAVHSESTAECPLASQLATVKVATPLLANPLTGEVFLATPDCSPCSQADDTSGLMYRLYLVAEGSGVVVKLPGTVIANPETGRLTATFDENPQLPFSELELKFKGGPRAPLANPAWCEAATTTTDLTPWSSPQTPDATPSSIFDTDYNGAGEACPGSVPFAPTLNAGATSVAAGAYAPLTVSFSRGDRQQTLSQISVQTPPGLLGKIAGVTQCGEAQANAGSCPAASAIGTTTVGAGSGPHPFSLAGTVYLTGPYRGAPFGLSIVVPATAGPFTLSGTNGSGDVVVRAAIDVNPATAALTITANPLPQILDGIPLRLQSVDVDVDRPDFTRNPTDCTESSVAATITGDQGASANVTSPFDVGGCQSLAFKAKLSASSRAKTSRKEGAGLSVKIRQGAGEADIHKVDVQLPKILAARETPTLEHACTEQQFAADPAGCPEDSFVGTGTAVTPLLGVPLSGPAIFVSHGGAAFPDLDVILQGEGVTIELTGHTVIHDGITFSRFESVPDAPISSFDLSLPQGPHSALAAPAANRSLCGKKLAMPTTIEGQNGAIEKQTTSIIPTGCGPVLSVKSHKVSGRTVTLKVRVPSAGTIKASANGLTSKTKKPGKAKLVTLKLKLSNATAARLSKGKRIKAKIELRFTPKNGARKLVKHLTASFKDKTNHSNSKARQTRHGKGRK